MVDQLTLQTVGIVIAAVSVVIGVLNSIWVSRRDDRRQGLLLRNRELTLESRQIGLYMEFTKIIQGTIDDYTDVMYNQEWTDFGDYLRKYGPTTNPEAFNKFIKVADVFHSLGALVADGVFEIESVYERSGFTIIPAWEKIGPVIQGMRSLSNNPAIFPQFEYLYNELVKYRETVSD